MSDNLLWRQHSGDIDNADNLAAIAQWWADLQGKEIFWQQRLLTDGQDLTELDWQQQKFDEKFEIYEPQLRGITIFWRNHPTADERNITASQLNLDLNEQKLYIYPQSQSQVVICVSLPVIAYQQIGLVNPQIAASSNPEGCVILLRDKEQKLDVKINLNHQKMMQLLDSLNSQEK